VSRNDVILGVAALVLVVFSLVVSLVIPRRDPGFPGSNLRVFAVVATLLVVVMLVSVEVFGDAHESEAAEEGEAADGGEGDAAAGEAIFASSCGSCHTLEEAGTSATVGPNLDESTVDLEAAVEQVTNGGGGMPAFEGQLSQQEIEDVAAYVVASQG